MFNPSVGSEKLVSEVGWKYTLVAGDSKVKQFVIDGNLVYSELPTMGEVWDEKELMQLSPEEGPWKCNGEQEFLTLKSGWRLVISNCPKI